MHAGAAPPRATQASSAESSPTLFYDGTCGLCARGVQFVLRHERASHALHFATLQGAHAARLLAGHQGGAPIDSVIWLEPSTDGGSRALVRSDAVLAVLHHLGGGWRWLARLGRLVPRVARDALYRLVARYRYRVFGRDQGCLLPTPAQRARFLDDRQ